MSASDAYESDILGCTFKGTLSFSADTNIYCSLHTGDPGDAGNQSTSECAYGSYARVAVARSAVGWSVSGNVAFNLAAINFPAGTSGAELASHFGLGRSLTAGAAGTLHFSGALTSSLAVGAGITPSIAAEALRVSAT